jgi:hypothetical protein
MFSRLFAITALSAGLAALPMLASAQTSTTTTPTPQTTMPRTTMPQATQPMNHGMNTSSGSMTHSGNMAQSGMHSGSMNMGSTGAMGGFDARHYRTAADCLNAATAAHVDLSACSSLHNR